jgi:Cu2+-exporting ATPase
MLPWVIAVARKVRRTILTNLLWAFGYNLVALTLAALGVLQPVLAAAVMASSSLLLVINSLQLSRLPDPALSVIPQRPSAEPDSVSRGLGMPVMAGPAIERS